MDNKVEMDSILVEQMIKTPGWTIVELWLRDKVNTAKNRLQTIDASDIKKIVEYQMTIKNYESLLTQIKHFVEKK